MNNSKNFIIHRDLRSARLRGSRSVAALLLLSCSFVGSATAKISSAVQAQPYHQVVFVPSAEQPLVYAGVAADPGAGNQAQMVIRAQVQTDQTTGAPEIGVAHIGKNLGLTNEEVTQLSVSPDGRVLTVVGAAPADAAKIAQLYAPAASDEPAGQASGDLTDAAANATKAVVAHAANDKYVFAAVSQKAAVWSLGTGVDRGIAVVGHGNAATAPEQKDPANLTTAGNARKLELKLAAGAGGAGAVDQSTDNGLHFRQDPGAVGGVPAVSIAKLLTDNVAMHWNPYNDRLYVGLGGIQRGLAGDTAGVVGITMGRVTDDGKKFVLNPFVQKENPAAAGRKELQEGKPTVDLFTTNALTGLVGGVFDTADLRESVAINKIASMRTSTGKDYLIFDSKISRVAPGAPAGGAGVGGILGGAAPAVAPAAVPGAGSTHALAAVLLHNGGNAAADESEKIKGSLAQTRNGGDAVQLWDAHPEDADTMPLYDAGHPQFLVAPGFDPANIADLFVEGDSVFIAANGATAAKQGLFQSRALFDENGYIERWTAPQQLMAGVHKVSGGGFDVGTDTAVVIAAKDAAGTDANQVIHATHWAEGVQPAVADSLRAALAAVFPAEQGGVHALHAFGHESGAFAPNSMSMLVAIGGSKGDKVALVQTARQNLLGHLMPDSQFLTAAAVAAAGAGTQNIFVFENDPVLTSIAPITSACVVQDYIFVGGENGVAVLSCNTLGLEGRGWSARAAGGGDLRNLNEAVNQFPGDGTVFTWKKIEPRHPDLSNFDGVQKLVGSDDQLLILTSTALYRVRTDDANKFGPGAATLAATAGGAALGEVDLLRLSEYEAAYGANTVATAAAGGGGYLDPVNVKRETDLRDRLNGAVLLDVVALAHEPLFTQTFVIASTVGIDVIKIATPAPAAGAVPTQLLPANNFERTSQLDGKIIIGLELLTSGRGAPSRTGELVALEADFTRDPSDVIVHRFKINGDAGLIDDAIQPVTSDGTVPVNYQLSQPRTALVSVPSGYVHVRGKHLNDTNFAELLIPTSRINKAVSTELATAVQAQAISSLFENDVDVSLVGRPVIEPVSGNILVPGEWGVVVRG